MKTCTGAPAEHCASAYVEGTLPEFEMERFEDHYFDCPVCLAHLQAVQAVEHALQHQPAVQSADIRPRTPLAWPRRTWTLAAVAALLLIAVVTFRMIGSRPAQPTAAQNNPAATPQPVPAQPPSNPAPIKASQLADLALPAFIAPNLRGATEEAHFQAGMAAYRRGDCSAALLALAQVPAGDAEARAAKFYSGACRMRQSNLSAAAATFRQVADQGDSPQQESALYYLAQIDLARNDPAAAHRLLLHAISLQGDLETRARAEDKKVLEIVNRDRGAGASKPESR